MKRTIIAAVTALLVLTGSIAVYAEENRGLEAGVKIWWSKWKQDAPGLPDITSDSAVLIGPEIRATFPSNLFLQASYLRSLTDYEFSDGIDEDQLERQDMDFAVGYMVIPELGVLAGYRDVQLEETGLKETFYGPLVGIRALVPMTEPFWFYGNLKYLITRFKQEDEFGTFREKSPGWIAEIGLKIDFTDNFSGNFGYLWETSRGKDTDIRDTFTGLTLGAFFEF